MLIITGPNPQIQTDGLYAALGPLPSGFEMRNTKNGRPFFINHKTKETTWVRDASLLVGNFRFRFIAFRQRLL